MSLAVDIDMRDRFGPPRDQRRRPTCLAFAASAAHEASRGDTEYLSTEALFYMGVQRTHKDPNRGLTLAAASEALRADGQPVESAWPYLLETPVAKDWKPPVLTDATRRATLEFSSRSVAEVRELLRSGTPVLLVLAVTLAMYTPDQHGIIRASASDKITTSRHAVVAVGSAHADDGGYILVRNSWGPTWGRCGHGWLHDDYLAKQLRTTGLII